MPLNRELEVYRQHLHEWSEHEGRFVLIHRQEVVDFYTSYEDALKVGYDKFGLDPFLVKQVNVIERVQFVSRCATLHQLAG